MPSVLRTGCFAWFVAATLGGCHSVAPTSTDALDKLLKPVAMTPDKVLLEVYQIRVSPAQRAAADAAWAAADEQVLSPELRTKLLANGLRAGVVGTAMPSELTKLLNPDGSASTPNSGEQLITQKSISPPAAKRIEQLRSHEEMTVLVNEVRDSLSLLISDDSVRGRTYSQVQTAYVVKAAAEPGQQVVVRVTPELQYGEIRNRYQGRSDQGIFMYTPSRERESYPQLAIEAKLAPGESLLLGGLADSAGSLGHALHGSVAKDEAVGESRLVLVRVAKVPDSEILAER